MSQPDTGEKLTLTIEVASDGGWSASRGMIDPRDFPRMIVALQNLLANMKEENNVFQAKMAISDLVNENRCQECWMHEPDCEKVK